MESRFVLYVLDLLAELGPVSARRMFGGYGIYFEGVMIGLIAKDVLYMKVDEQNQPRFEEEGCEPFLYRRKGRDEPVQMSYWEAPADAMENGPLLCDWAREAHAAAMRSKPAKRKRPKKKRL